MNKFDFSYISSEHKVMLTFFPSVSEHQCKRMFTAKCSLKCFISMAHRNYLHYNVLLHVLTFNSGSVPSPKGLPVISVVRTISTIFLVTLHTPPCTYVQFWICSQPKGTTSDQCGENDINHLPSNPTYTTMYANVVQR